VDPGSIWEFFKNSFWEILKNYLTVTKMPIITPTTGFDKSSDCEKKPDKFRPPRIRKELLKKVKEQTNR
jgi:hypothetical protein